MPHPPGEQLRCEQLVGGGELFERERVLQLPTPAPAPRPLVLASVDPDDELDDREHVAVVDHLPRPSDPHTHPHSAQTVQPASQSGTRRSRYSENLLKASNTHFVP